MNQKELFWKIWKNNDHECSICEEELEDPPKSYYFAHILPKGLYPKYKFNEENIILLCLDCHQKFDHNTHIAKADPRFSWLFAHKDFLKSTYPQI